MENTATPSEFGCQTHHVWRRSACEICRLPDLGPVKMDAEPSIRSLYGGNPSRLWTAKAGRGRKVTEPEPVVEPVLPDDLDAQPEPELHETEEEPELSYAD